jgi:hypothetical protein
VIYHGAFQAESDDDDKRNYSSDIKGEKQSDADVTVKAAAADDYMHDVQDLEKRIMDGTATDCFSPLMSLE